MQGRAPTGLNEHQVGVARTGQAGALLVQLAPLIILRRIDEGVVSARRNVQRLAALDFPRASLIMSTLEVLEHAGIRTSWETPH